MNQPKFFFSFAWIAALLVAAPAMGQLLNHPVHSLPAGPADGATFVAAQGARGFNNDSNKQSSFAAAVGRGMERASFAGMVGYVGTDTDELTLGASVAVHLLPEPDAVQVSLQGGFGWVSLDGTPDNTSLTNYPIGLAISAAPSDSGTSVRPWVMPRLNIVRQTTGGTRITDTDFGVSWGLSWTNVGGFGVHISADWVAADTKPFGLALGFHFVTDS